MRSSGILWAVAAVALAGCDLGTGPGAPATPAIWTDRPEYVVQGTQDGWRAEIPYTFTNLTGATVHLANCNGAISLRLDRWQGGEWVPAWSPILPLCLSAPIPIEAGGTYPDTVHFFAGYAGTDVFPQLGVEQLEGTYRIVWLGLLRDYDLDGGSTGTEVPLRYRTSNQFQLRVRP